MDPVFRAPKPPAVASVASLAVAPVHVPHPTISTESGRASRNGGTLVCAALGMCWMQHLRKSARRAYNNNAQVILPDWDLAKVQSWPLYGQYQDPDDPRGGNVMLHVDEQSECAGMIHTQYGLVPVKLEVNKEGSKLKLKHHEVVIQFEPGADLQLPNGQLARCLGEAEATLETHIQEVAGVQGMEGVEVVPSFNPEAYCNAVSILEKLCFPPEECKAVILSRQLRKRAKKTGQNLKELADAQKTPMFESGKVPVPHDWIEVNTRKDLRVESWRRSGGSWGDFDVQAALKHWQRRKDVSEKVPSVQDLKAAGYVLKYFKTCIDLDAEQRALLGVLRQPDTALAQYLVQHHEFWQKPQNTNRIDEVQEHFEGMTREDFQGQPKPSVLLARLTRERQASLGQFKSERIFPCLQFCDEILHEEAHFKVESLRSYQEIAEAAEALKNCAQNYVSSAASGKCFLVVLKKAENMVAMAEWRPEERRYVQLVESCNQPLREEWKQVFMRAEGQMPKALSVTFKRVSEPLFLVGSSSCKMLQHALLGMMSETNGNLTIELESLIDHAVSPQQLGDGGTLDSETDPCYEGILAAVPSIANLAMDEDDRKLLGAVLQGGVSHGLEKTAKAGSLVIKDMKMLIAAGLGPYLPLRAAVFSGSVKMTQMLLEAGADVNAAYCHGLESPFYRALTRGQAAIAEMLWDWKAEVDIPGEMSPVHQAVQGGYANHVLIEKLIHAGYSVNAEDEKQEPPLNFAMSTGHFDLVSTLLKARADVNKKSLNEYGARPLHLLALSPQSDGRLKVAKMLLKARADLHALDHGGWAPLHSAAHFSRCDIVQFLLQSRADVHAKTHKGREAFDLVFYDSDPDNSDRSSQNLPLQRWWMNPDPQQRTALALADGGADLHSKHELLGKCVQLDSEELVQRLVESRADVNATYEVNDGPMYGYGFGAATPLSLLANESPFNLEMAELLVNLDADVNTADQDGKTPLHSAAERGTSKMAMFLANSSADVDAADTAGRTPLHSAVSNTYTELSLFTLGPTGPMPEGASLERIMEVLSLLVEAKADLGHRDRKGETPLHAAASTTKVKAAKFLIDARADINAKNKSGQTPLDNARWARPNVRQMVHLLESSGGMVGGDD